MHAISDTSAVWHGGIGHRILGIDGGIECYRCGMAADDSAWQELVPDCDGPAAGGDHHWMGEYASDGTERNVCAYGDSWIGPYGGMEHAGGRCKRA